MILGILFFPKIRLSKKITVDSCWVIAMLGLILLLLFNCVNVNTLAEKLTEDSAVNPIKILVLFLSMTFLSVFLDELGFFRYFASLCLNKANGKQIKLFCVLYFTVSILTVFTSNDVIILSFTPFILYFCRSAKINPLPYLLAEFVGANSWSMMLIIGNPTNIYLASSSGIDFISYFKVMAIPTIVGSLVGFLFLYLMFNRSLKKPIEKVEQTLFRISDKTLFVAGATVLSGCTITLAISAYVDIQMYLVSLLSALALILIVLIISLIKKRKPTELFRTFLRLPYQLIPFVLAMFSIIIALQTHGVSQYLANFLGQKHSTFVYGLASFFSANILNNIPMSVIFSSIIESASPLIAKSAIYATVVGSNLGALFTPIGALAGIMWSSMLNEQGLKTDFKSFLKMGVLVALPALFATLLVLGIVL